MAISAYATTSSRWLACQSRDPRSSEAFVYCVTTTKIYCRPTCAARLARRANVEFHDSPSDAERDGYRACKRCKPDVERDWDPWSKIIREACKAIEVAVAAADDKDGKVAEDSSKNDDGRRKRRKIEGSKLTELARGAGLTQSHFHRTFKKVTGFTPKQYRNNLMEKKNAGKRKTNEAPSSIGELANEHTADQDDFRQNSNILGHESDLLFSDLFPLELPDDSFFDCPSATPTTSSSTGIFTPPVDNLISNQPDPQILDIDTFINETMFEDWITASASEIFPENEPSWGQGIPILPINSPPNTRVTRQSTKEKS